MDFASIFYICLLVHTAGQGSYLSHITLLMDTWQPHVFLTQDKGPPFIRFGQTPNLTRLSTNIFLGKHRSRYVFLVKAAKCYLSVYSSKKPLEHEISSKYCTIVARKSNGNSCAIVPYKFSQHLIVFEQMTTPKECSIVLRRYHWPEPTVHITKCSP